LEQTFSLVLADINWVPFSISLGILLILLACSALISGAEVAFFSLTPSDKESIGEGTSKSAETTLALLSTPKGLLATILIANNFINVAIILLSSQLSTTLLEGMDDRTKFFVDVIAITFILLLFGEVIPKVYAAKNGKKVALLMAVPLRIIGKTFPFNLMKKGLVQGTDVINRRIKKRVKELSQDDLSDAIELAIEGYEDKSDLDIYQGIIEFGKKDVKQIMRSRLDVDAFEFDKTYGEILALLNGDGIVYPSPPSPPSLPSLSCPSPVEPAPPPPAVLI